MPEIRLVFSPSSGECSVRYWGAEGTPPRAGEIVSYLDAVFEGGDVKRLYEPFVREGLVRAIETGLYYSTDLCG